MKILSAGVIIIGDEVLSGRTKDKNIGWVAEQLTNHGIKLVEARIIMDDHDTIVETIRKLSKEVNYVFTSGGIGPTHDDITSESVSSAFELDYEINQQAFKILKKYYPSGEFNESRQRMA